MKLYFLDFMYIVKLLNEYKSDVCLIFVNIDIYEK